MSLLHTEIPLAAALLGWLLILPLAGLAAWTARARFLPNAGAQHLWLGGALLLAFLWMMQVKVGDGVHLGMFGAALYALIFGRAWALLGLLLALALHILFTGGAWLNFGVNALLFAAGPVWSTTALQGLLAARLPKNLFIFIIGNGMFVTLAASALTGLALLAVDMLWAAPHVASQFGDYAGYSLLLAWGEALASGMIFSALTIFCPALVLTYRQDIYLPRWPQC